MTCEEARQLAPEAALDLLDAARRANVLGHVATCGGCRAELAELAATADALLVLAPPAEPTAGFEQRVLARLDAERSPARRRALATWVRPALVAAAAAVVALVAGIALGSHGGDGGDGLVAGRLLGTDGQAVGQVLVSDGPDRMVCVLDRAPAGVRYAVTVSGRDGVADVGTFTSQGPGKAWATALPIDAADVRRVVIRDAAGNIRATADL
jgi:predicted anti-sigma-YlaC factor YlaD